MGDISLDRQKLKAILNETRMQILKQLARRRYTITELSELLNTAKSNIAVHIEKLEESGLVTQVDEGRKWKYCELTNQGRGFVDSISIGKQIVILLATILLMAVIALHMILVFNDAIYQASLQGIDSELGFIPVPYLLLLLFLEIVLGFVFLAYAYKIVKTRFFL